MARIIAKAAAMGATLVLQANEAIDNLPARAAILERLMVSNGYPDVRVHAPSGFARPLLVATAADRGRSGDKRVRRARLTSAPSGSRDRWR